jgi:uncharacterized linocin/CFP29 family protein
MDPRLRELAPLSDHAWEEVEGEATRSLKNFLAARRFADFTGPLGFEMAGISTGRLRPIGGRSEEPAVTMRVREFQPLVELRRAFRLDRSEIEAIDRGAKNGDLKQVVDAARAIALAEDGAIFHGLPAAEIEGICSASPHPPITIGENYEDYPRAVVQALHTLDLAGVTGPYGLALGPRCWSGLMQTVYPGGFPVIDPIRKLIAGPVVRALALNGACVLSLRGGDFELISGADLGLGYLGHDVETVTLYLEESMTFRIHTPEAAVWLRYQ